MKALEEKFLSGELSFANGIAEQKEEKVDPSRKRKSDCCTKKAKKTKVENEKPKEIKRKGEYN